MQDHGPDWPWRPEDFTASPFDGTETAAPDRIPLLAARCFRGADGVTLLSYLRGLTLDRALGPDASDAALRHLEGQRHLIRHLCHLVELGRGGPDNTPTPKGDIS